jgi:hypothetical protein
MREIDGVLLHSLAIGSLGLLPFLVKDEMELEGEAQKDHSVDLVVEK